MNLSKAMKNICKENPKLKKCPKCGFILDILNTTPFGILYKCLNGDCRYSFHELVAVIEG